jgi:hypothetical protein
MTRELHRWLPDLAPPAGGELRLRAAIDTRGRETAPSWHAALAAVCCVLLAAIALPAPGARAPRPDIARALDLLPPPGVQVAGGAALEVPVAAEGVRLVLVMDLGEAPIAR